MSSPAKGPGGRPSIYDPAIGDMIADLMGDGYSIRGACGMIGVSKSAVYEWEQKHPEFADALNRGRDAAAAWWESCAIRLARDKDADSAPMVIFGLKNRVADEWRDVNRTEHTGKDGGPIQSEDVTADAADFTSRLARLAAASGAGTASGDDPAGNEGGT